MKVCGVEIKGSHANIVILDGNVDSYMHVVTDPRRVDLDDDESTEHVRSFRDVFQALVRDQQIEHVAIKKRNKKGEYAGGPTSFKIEGILQLLDECQVHLLAPVTISSIVRKSSPALPDTLRRYQESAFKAAFATLHRISNG